MTTATKTKGMCIATRCTSVPQFIQMFHRFVDEESFFVSTHNTRPPGLETSFSVNLADGTPVLRGLCVVMQAWPTANNPFKTPGVRLGIKRLTANSMPVFEQLLITRSVPNPPPSVKPEFDTLPTKNLAAPPPTPAAAMAKPAKPAEPEPIDSGDPEEPEIETRTPGSDYILPANPLMNLTDESLDGFVDCTLYEETGNFFPVDDDSSALMTDDVVPPPVLAPRVRAASPVVLTPPMPMPTVAPAPPLTMTSPTIPPPMSVVSAPIDMSALIQVSAPTTTIPPPMGMPAPTIPPPLAMPAPLAVAAPNDIAAFQPRVDLEPRARRRTPPMWMLGGGFAVIAIATLAIVLSSKKSSGSPNTAESTTTKVDMHAVVAQAEPLPKLAVPEPAIPDSPEKTAEQPEEPATDGPPVIGEGPCKLAIATTPAGSMITLDGKVLAPSPVTVATSCDKHAVSIDHPRYKPATRSVTLTEAKPGSLEVSLDRPTHAVSVNSLPQGATVFIDGRRAGTTPTVLSVMGFQSIKLELKKTGYLPQTTKLYSKLANDKVSVKLKKW